MLQQNKLLIAGVSFVVLLGAAMFALKKRDEGDAAPVDEESLELPEIDRDAITALELTRPGDEEGQEATVVRLEKVDDAWRVVSPVEAEADQSAVDTALDKLGELELTGVVANNATNHARLEVDEENGVRVVISQGDADPITLFVGARRGQSTMLRLDGDDRVLGVAGSIKYAFNKELKDWRNRRVVDVDPERVRRVRFESEDGTFEFTRAEDDWALVEGQEPIERFGSSKVQSLVASVARMRAVDFGAADDETGLDSPSGTVTLYIGPEVEESEGEEEEADDSDTPEGEEADEAQPTTDETPEDLSSYETVVIRVGGARGEEREFFLQREGNPVVYVVSQYLADRIRPDTAQFQDAEPGAAPEAPPPGGMPPGMPGLEGLGGLGGPGGNPSQMIPPELMQQIQQQIQQQQAAGMR